MGVAITAGGCGLIPMEPGPGLRAWTGLAPSLTEEAAAVYRALPEHGLAITNLRVTLSREDGGLAVDTVVAVAPGQDSVVLQLSVVLHAPKELVRADVELRDSAMVLFSGYDHVTLRRGVQQEETPLIRLEYSGPDARARGLELTPRDTTIVARDSVRYTARAYDDDGLELKVQGVAWSLSDGARGAISANGVFASATPGETWVIARLPNGVRDSARVVVHKRGKAP